MLLARFSRPLALLFVVLSLALSALSAQGTLAQTASQQENVSNTADQSEAPEAVAVGTTLRVVWGERASSAIAVSEKTVGGGWPGATTFADGSQTQYQWPDIAVTPNGVTHIVYAAGDTVFHRSRAGGGGWSTPHEVGADNFPNPVRVAASPNGSLWVVWRDTEGTAVQFRRSTDGGLTWSGGIVASEPGNMFGLDIAAGPNSVPHVVWFIRSGSENANTARVADWTGSGWTVGSSGGGSGYLADPVIVVDSNNAVHLAYRRQRGDNWLIQHAVRAPGQGWGQESVRETPGNAGYAPSIAVDRRGGVHITWSELTSAGGRDVFYSFKPSGGTFTTQLNVSERAGGWNSRSSVVTTESGSEVIAHVFYQRGERGRDVDEIFYRAVYPAATPTPTSAPTATATPRPNAPATGMFDFGSNAFRDLWTRTDSLVRQNEARYSWIWGPAPFTQGFGEYYVQSPGQSRVVQYFDKSRMEINQPGAPRGPWYVTNGRLADELITGQMQTGDAQYEQRNPAGIAVGGDPDNTFPYYRDLRAVYRRARSGDRANEEIFRALDGSVQLKAVPSANSDPSMAIAQRVGSIGIPRVFWSFMNQPGRVLENGRLVNASPLFDWRFVIGEPLTEAYWTYIKVNGRFQGVLVQAFERRVLTYTPANGPEFQVEMGNIGRHYFEWRYGVRPQ